MASAAHAIGWAALLEKWEGRSWADASPHSASKRPRSRRIWHLAVVIAAAAAGTSVVRAEGRLATAVHHPVHCSAWMPGRQGKGSRWCRSACAGCLRCSTAWLVSLADKKSDLKKKKKGRNKWRDLCDKETMTWEEEKQRKRKKCFNLWTKLRQTTVHPPAQTNKRNRGDQLRAPKNKNRTS